MKKGFFVFEKVVLYLTWMLLLVSIGVDVQDQVWWRVFIWVFLLAISIYYSQLSKRLSSMSSFLISLMILSAIFGELFTQLYYHFSLYDKILHLVIPLGIVFIAYDFLEKSIPEKNSRLKRAILYALIISFSWEVLEILFDIFFDSQLVGVFSDGLIDENLAGRIELVSPWLDTLYDVILDILGIALAGFFLSRKNKKSSEDTSSSSQKIVPSHPPVVDMQVQVQKQQAPVMSVPT